MMTGDNRRTAAKGARETAGITFGADNLFELVLLKMIASGLSARTGSKYRLIIGFNSAAAPFIQRNGCRLRAAADGVQPRFFKALCMN